VSGAPTAPLVAGYHRNRDRNELVRPEAISVNFYTGVGKTSVLESRNSKLATLRYHDTFAMSVLIFRLNGVPADEAADVRKLLDDRGFEYHETSGGLPGISVAGLWLLDDSQRAAARAAIDAYQLERSARIAAEHEDLRRAGQVESTWQRVVRRPLQSLLYLAGAAAVLYLMLWPFLTLGR
jgi:hypothetical protein